jgi:Outer membrane lipoprotein carrier protein LolA
MRLMGRQRCPRVVCGGLLVAMTLVMPTMDPRQSLALLRAGGPEGPPSSGTGGPGFSPDSSARDLFDEIYERSRPMEQSLKTIRARFTEETTSSLLTRPLTAEGTLLVVRPSDVVLTYTKPERKTLRLDAERLLFEWPARGLRDSKNIRESQARVRKYFVDKSPSELRKHFTIAASEDRARAGTWRIEMVPTRKQIEQELSRLDLWVRQDTMMLDAMRMTFPGGDTKTMTFTDVVVNQPVAEDELRPSSP